MSGHFSSPPQSSQPLPVALPISPSRNVLDAKVADAASRYRDQWDQLVSDLTHTLGRRKVHGNISVFLLPALNDAPDVTRFFDVNVSQCTKDSLHEAWLLAKSKHERNELTAAQLTAYFLHKLRVLAMISLPTAAPSDGAMSDHLAEHFHTPFHGHAIDNFLAFVQDTHITLHNKGPYYLGTPIVQSSGTGKTRLVLQLATKAPLLYVCARQPTPSGANQGFPPGDLHVNDFFRTASDSNQTAAAFIGALFSHVAESLEQVQHATAKLRFLQSLLDFSSSQQSERGDFFLPIMDDAARTRLREQDISKQRKEESFTPMYSRCLDAPVVRLSAQIRAIANGTAGMDTSKIPTTQNGHPIFFVAIDECVDLDVGSEGGARGLESLRRAWNYVGSLEATHKVCFWLVLLSTNSSAARLVTPVALLKSQRAIESPQMPAFFNLGFDVKLSEQTPLQRARDAAQFEQLCYYGRPLWMAQYLAHDKKLLDFWRTTRAKLRFSTSDDIDDNYGTSFYDQVSLFNVLASRLSIQALPVQHFGVQNTNPSIAQASIDRHMRVLKEIDDHEKLIISAPSEPVLAIAAADVMTELNKSSPSSLYSKMLRLFTQTSLTPERLITFKGDFGELATRIILMCASDACKRASTAVPIHNPSDRAMHLAKPIALLDLVHKLVVLPEPAQNHVQDRIATTVREVRTDLIRSLKLSGLDNDLANEAWVSFTHFDTASDGIDKITPGFLWACWKRGVAIQTDHSQYGIDGIIPVFLGSLDLAFASVMAKSPLQQDSLAQESLSELIESLVAPELMSYVAWSSKNRGRPLSVKTRSKPVELGPVISHAANIVAGTQEGSNRRGFLTIEFDLGSTAAFANKDSLSDHARLSDHETLNGCFLSLRGIDDPMVYPCLDDLGCRDALRKILQSRLNKRPKDVMPDPLNSLIGADRDQCTFGEVGNGARELYRQKLLALDVGDSGSEGDMMTD